MQSLHWHHIIGDSNGNIVLIIGVVGVVVVVVAVGVAVVSFEK